MLYHGVQLYAPWPLTCYCTVSDLARCEEAPELVNYAAFANTVAPVQDAFDPYTLC